MPTYEKNPLAQDDIKPVILYVEDANDNLIPVEADSSGRILVQTSASATSLADGRKVVAAAGTREALAASTSCTAVAITAETDNTGVIVVGGSTVVATLATRRGTPLSAGDSVTIDIDNLADIYLDSTVSGDGVTYTYTA